jgi:hypothetical protein
MKKLILIIFATSSLSYGDEAKNPIEPGSKLKKEKTQQVAETFTPTDNADRSKISTKEISEVNAMDSKAFQEKVDVIRNKVLDAKSKLIETTKQEIITGAPRSYLVIEHKDNMSSRFSILNLTYVLDGRRIYSDYDLYRNKKDVYPVFSAFVAPGHHEVLVEMVCSGSEDSAFDYLKDYRIKVKNRYSFVTPNSGKMKIEGASHESGTIFTSFKDRPAIDFDSSSENKITENIEK